MPQTLTKRQEALRDRMSKLCEMSILLDKVIEYPEYYEEYDADELEEEYQDLFGKTVMEFG